MGKIHDGYPNGQTALAQWVKRKLKNHDPMSEVDAYIPANQVHPAFKKLGRVKLHKERACVHYLLDNGDAYLITVEKTSPEKLQELPLENTE